ncbi:MAG: hypothetical protein Q4G69_12655 [Planctomycetia bacterium]|nr:hypothetical protein [Planctomycetia bacterium]
MKKYMILLIAALVFCCTGIQAGEFGDLLSRLDSRDFSAEKDVALKTDGPYKGETSNPHEDTIMFKARAELFGKIMEARLSADLKAQVNAFLADAVQQDIKSDTKSWLIRQFPYTATAKEVSVLVPFLKNSDKMLVDAAASALGKIALPEAKSALEANSDVPAAKAALITFNNTVPPLQPAETVKPLALENTSKADFDEWMKGYSKLSDQEKVCTIAAITARQDTQYRNIVREAIASDSAELKKAGFLALEKLATKEDVDFLVGKLADEHDLALRLCGFIVADGFDDALLAKFNQAADPKQFLDLATILINRSVDIRKDVFAKTTAENCPARIELLKQIVKICTPADVPELLASVLLLDRKDLNTGENLIAGCCNGDASPIIKLLGKYPPAVIYPIMCRTGGNAAKAELSRGLDSSDPALLEAAFRSLAQWTDALFADKMMAIITSEKYPEGLKISILRAYIRVMSLPDDKIGIKITNDQRLANLKNAFNLSTRLDEKRWVLSRLAPNRSIQSFEFVLECAADPDLAEAAYSAIVDHAHDTAFRNTYAKQVLPALNLVIEKTKNKKLVERANLYKGRMM